MLKRILLPLLISANIAACGGGNGDESGGDSLPATAFSGDYEFADFNPDTPVEYWEIRLGPLPRQELSEFEVRQSYGEIDALDETQRELLRTSASQTGFAAACAPSFCPIYAVGIAGYDVMTIDSSAALADFFGDIDTEAELYTYLDYNSGYEYSTKPLTYEKVDRGYRVVLQWDTLCQLRGEDLVKVHADGTVEKVKELSTETYSSCA